MGNNDPYNPSFDRLNVAIRCMTKQEISTQELAYVQNLVKTHSAIVLEPDKAYLVESRLGPLAKREGFPTLNAFVAKLRTSSFSALHKEAVEVMTTNETSFFRDQTPFAVFRDPLLPEIIKRNSQKKRLNIWCGASSSGQEPYSILLTILEHFPELRTWEIKFFVTDLSQKMIARCREGQYSHLEIQRGLLPTHRTKYFIKNTMGWQIRDEIRSMLELREMNLAGTWLAFPKMDFVFIRNVLIYFDVQTKKQILEKVRGILEPHGYLFLGGTESTINLDELYERVALGGTFVYQRKK